MTTITVGSTPYGVAVSNSYAFVANNGANTVSVIDLSSLTVAKTITVGTGPFGVGVSASYAFVTDLSATSVSVIDLSSLTVTKTITVGTNPRGVAVSTAHAFVANYVSGSVSVIDLSSLTVTSTISVGGGPWGVAVSNSYAFVTNYSGGTVFVIDLSSLTVTKTITVGTNPRGVAVSNSYAFVANNGANTVSVIDLSSLTVTKTITVGTGPWGVGVSASHAFVANSGAGTVSVIDLSTLTVTSTATVGSTPIGVAVSTAHAFVANNGANTVSVIDLSSAPSAPTLASPASGQVLDATSGVTFQATYHSTDAQNCNAYTLRLKTGTGAYSYWKASTSSWSSTEVWNTLGTTVADGGTITIVIPHSATLTNGNTYSWSVNTQESGANLQGTYATDSTFTARTPPAVDITAPVDGSTITDTQTPTASWTSVLAPGTTQTAYRVVWESGSYGTTPGSGTSAADTGMVSSAATSVTCPTALSIGVTYRMFAQITETGGESSVWEYVTFTVTLAPPNAPTLTTLTGTDPTTGLPTVTITATVTDSASFDHTDTTVQVQESFDGGNTWVTVRDATTGNLATGVALNSSGAGSVIDGEALFGVPTSYRANATGTASGATVVGAWSDTVTATLDCTVCWLVNPLNLSTALQVAIQNADTRSRAITQDMSAWAGGQYPVIGQDVWQAPSSSLTWQPRTKTVRDKLEALLKSQGTLLQRTPAEQGDAGAHVYFRVTGLSRDRIEQAGTLPVRLVKAAWVDRARP